MSWRNSSLVVALVALLMVSNVNCHNWLVNPVSRANQHDTQTGCRYGGEGNPTCAGPCDRTLSQTTRAPIAVQRGQTLDIQWNRHNHPGGFIRFAWSPTTQSDSHASFDTYVDHFVCKDSGGCGPANPSHPTGTPNGLNCAASITVPLWVTNGAWTLQWAYFGGWYNAGDYYACVITLLLVDQREQNQLLTSLEEMPPIQTNKSASSTALTLFMSALLNLA